MKRILSALIISAAFLAGCSEEISMKPGISFLTPDPEVFEETAIFRIIGQPFSEADSVKIPVVFGGTAVRGEDYDVSADYFTYSKESLIDSIVVYTKHLGSGKNVTLSLQIPDGFVAGKYASAEFKLQDKYGLLNFDAPKGLIADTTQYNVKLSYVTGTARVLSKTTPISFAVNTEKSTAVEGVDFEFIGSSNMSIAQGNSTAGFTIAPIKGNLKEGKDKIVLNVVSDERFEAGETAEMELQIIKPELNVLNGGWKIDTLVTDSLYFEQFWGNTCTGYSLVPEFSSSDSFDFMFDNATFVPYMNSGFKNYFIGKSDIEIGKEVTIQDPSGSLKEVLLISLNKTNRYFSADTVSTDSVSFVGIHLFKTEDVDMMELYILDHTSKSFMPEHESSARYSTEKPVATAPGTYLQGTFKKL